MIEITITALEIIGVGMICICVGGIITCICRRTVSIHA